MVFVLIVAVAALMMGTARVVSNRAYNAQMRELGERQVARYHADLRQAEARLRRLPTYQVENGRGWNIRY